MPKTTRVELTGAQCAQLGAMQAMLVAAENKGAACSLLAQVYPDLGIMEVALIDHETTMAIIKLTGGRS